MRVALVHELLTIKGGAERVFRIIADMFPDAPIYTLLYDKQKLSDWFPATRVTPLIKSRDTNHHHHLAKFPDAIDALDLSDFDLVISSSSAFVHGLHILPHATHICYVHSPAKYLWSDTHNVQTRASGGILGKLKAAYLSRTFHRLRVWDALATNPATTIVAPSKEVARRTQLYWNLPSIILHPPIDDFWFKNTKYEIQNTKYFLIVSTLARYKNLDYVIDACTKHTLPLKVVGEGPDTERLKKRAGPSVEFLGHKQDDELRDLYANATATIFAGREDFGLVPLESLACGTPVIAYGKGGALETVVEGITGTFFAEQNPDVMSDALLNFDHKKYTKENCQLAAQTFNQSEFEQKLRTIIDHATHS